MDTVRLSDPAGRGWVELRAGDVYARGYVQPRLLIALHAKTPREKRWVDIHLLRATLSFNHEQIAEGLLTGIQLNYVERQITLEIPVERAALQYVTDNATGDQIDLVLDISGWMRVRRELTEDDPAYVQESPEPGEWGFLAFGSGASQVGIRIPRSNWFTRVLEPVGSLSYITTEIPLPKAAVSTEFSSVLNHLREAESKYATGDDAEVFFRCRAALEALPGAPQGVFDALPDSDEAACLNDLMKEAVDYLHRGRHTKREGDQRGDFPVDHGDARFALAITRLLVAQTSRVLARGMQ